MKTTDDPIIIEETFDNSIEIVWKAITHHDEMIKWYFENIPAFKPEVGFKTKFEVVSEDRKFTHNWEVTEVIPGKKISYTWRYLEYDGDALVTFELIKESNGVKLKLTLDVLEDFPEEIPEFKRESCIQGWNYFLGGRLRTYLASIE